MRSYKFLSAVVLLSLLGVSLANPFSDLIEMAIRLQKSAVKVPEKATEGLKDIS